MALLIIVRRVLGDARIALAISALAFFGLAVLWNWGVSVNQYPPPDEEAASESAGDDAMARGDVGTSDEDGELDEDERRRRRRRRGMGVYAFFGVPSDRLLDAENPPTLLMQVAVFNHPLITLAILGWAVSRASAAVAGEIERGTLDLTMSRPVRRSTYLAAQVAATFAVLATLGLALVAGHLASPLFFRLSDPPGPLAYWPSLAMLLGMGLAIFGYTLAFSSRDLSRARASLLGGGVTLAGIGGIIFARQLEGYEWLAKLSIFHYYYPVGLVNDQAGDALAGLGVLFGVFGAGLALSFLGFLTRDLPTSG